MYKLISDLQFEEEFKKEEIKEKDENEIFYFQNPEIKEKINSEVIRHSIKEFNFQEKISLSPVIDRLRNKKTISMRGIFTVPKNR